MSEFKGSFWVLKERFDEYLEDKNKDLLPVLSSVKNIHDKNVQQALLASCVKHNRNDVIEKYITDINMLIYYRRDEAVNALAHVSSVDMLLYLIQKGIDIFYVNTEGQSIVERYIVRV